MTDTTIKTFKDHQRIASNKRLYRRPDQYSTVFYPMPPDHQNYLCVTETGSAFRYTHNLMPNVYHMIFQESSYTTLKITASVCLPIMTHPENHLICLDFYI